MKVGEKVPLDGILLSDKASFNTAALSGESKPQSSLQGENVLAGSINLEGVVDIEVTKLFNDSSVSRILELVQNATQKRQRQNCSLEDWPKSIRPLWFT